jgi:hypothetical protein
MTIAEYISSEEAMVRYDVKLSWFRMLLCGEWRGNVFMGIDRHMSRHPLSSAVQGLFFFKIDENYDSLIQI